MSTMTLDQVLEEMQDCLKEDRVTRRGIVGAHNVVCWADAIDAHLAQPAQAVGVDSLAQEIRRVDGMHMLGAGALAEALMPFITRALTGEKAGPVDEPDQALLVSMATCLDHGFGLHDAKRQQSVLYDMRKLWDEVMGRGYYRPENHQRYLAYLASPAPDKEGKV